jgi:hypothetical protein
MATRLLEGAVEAQLVGSYLLEAKTSLNKKKAIASAQMIESQEVTTLGDLFHQLSFFSSRNRA